MSWNILIHRILLFWTLIIVIFGGISIILFGFEKYQSNHDLLIEEFRSRDTPEYKIATENNVSYNSEDIILRQIEENIRLKITNFGESTMNIEVVCLNLECGNNREYNVETFESKIIQINSVGISGNLVLYISSIEVFSVLDFLLEVFVIRDENNLQLLMVIMVIYVTLFAVLIISSYYGYLWGGFRIGIISIKKEHLIFLTNLFLSILLLQFTLI